MNIVVMIICWKFRPSRKYNDMQKKKPHTKTVFLEYLWSHCCWEKFVIPTKSGITVLVTNLGTDRRGQTTAFRLKANLNPFPCRDLVLWVKSSSSFLAMQVINIETDYHKPDNYSSSLKVASKGSMWWIFGLARNNNERRARLLY